MVSLRLEWLVVENFKSYRGQHHVGPFDRFSAVIGPNGSGKSNLMDAISFGLGVQSRQMRSTNLAALIYRPSSPEECAPSSASVSLIFRSPDDSTKTFKRTAHRNASAYEVDGMTVSAENFTEELRKLNIIVKARNFLVFQGDVVDVARRTPAELGNLFEQISGSDLLREEFESREAEVAAAGAELRLQLVQRQKLVVNQQRLQGDVEQARQHAELKGRLSSAESALIVAELYLNDCRAKEAKQEFDSYSEVERELSVTKQQNEETLRKCDAEVANLEAKAAATAKQVETLTAETVATDGKHQVLASRRAYEMKRRTELQAREEQLHLKQKKLREVLDEKQDTLQDTGKRLQDLENAAKNTPKSNKCHYSRDVVQRYEELRQSVAIKTSEVEASMAVAQTNLCAAERKLKAAKDLTCSAEKRAAELRVSLEAAEGIAVVLSEEAREVEQRRQQAEEELRSAEKDASIESERAGELQEKKAFLENQLHFLQANQNESHAERRRREAVAKLQGTVQGIQGILVELYRPAARKHKLAAAVALGKFADHVIVDTFDVGKKAIEALKSLKLPPLNFLPLDSVVTTTLPRGIRNIPNATLALDCVVFEDSMAPAFTAALGTTVIVDDLHTAERVAFKDGPSMGISVKVVTIDGDRILKNGNFTVDTKSRTTPSNAKEIADLQEVIRGIDEQLQSLSDSFVQLPALRQTCESLSARHGQLEKDNSSQLLRIKQLNRQLKETEDFARNQELEVGAAQDAVQRLSNELARYEKESERIQSEVFAELGENINIVELRKQEENKKNAAKRLNQETEVLRAQATRLQAECNALKMQESHLSSASTSTDLKDCLESIRQIENLAAQTEKQQVAIANQLQEAKANANTAAASKDRAKKRATEALHSLQAVTDKLQKIRCSTAKAGQRLEALTSEAVELLRKPLLRNIAIPLSKGSIHTFAKWCGIEISAAAENEMDEEQPEINYGAYLTKDEMDCFDSEAVVAEVFKRRRGAIAALQEEMQAIHVDPDALRKNDELTEQLNVLEGDIEAVEDRKKRAEKKFQSVRKERIRRFTACFQHVKNGVEETYANLTGGQSREDEHDRMGGEAFLELQEQPSSSHGYINTAVQFNVMPPSKRYSDIRRLSGGEKTIAALALLFALQSYNAAPFFVLDEIDAALDPKNVVALADYLRGAEYQVILISHSDRLFSQADRLIGIYVNSARESSEALTLSLLEFASATVPMLTV